MYLVVDLESIEKMGLSMYELSYAEDAENDIGDRDLENDCNDQQI